jgi:hypothetical protein
VQIGETRQPWQDTNSCEGGGRSDAQDAAQFTIPARGVIGFFERGQDGLDTR